STTTRRSGLVCARAICSRDGSLASSPSTATSLSIAAGWSARRLVSCLPDTLLMRRAGHDPPPPRRADRYPPYASRRVGAREHSMYHDQGHVAQAEVSSPRASPHCPLNPPHASAMCLPGGDQREGKGGLQAASTRVGSGQRRAEACRCVQVSVVIPALDEAENLRVLLPELEETLRQLGVSHEVLLVTTGGDTATREIGSTRGARVLVQDTPGYGGALATGFRAATGEFILTMDADLSHPPTFIADIWARRYDADVVVASPYVEGGAAGMPLRRYLLSRTLNRVFSGGLSLAVRDMSSGFRLYRARVLANHGPLPRDFDVLQALLVRAYAEGWRVVEVPFSYAPRQHGQSHARV